MPLQLLSIPRATQPHLPTLADTLRPLLAVANAGSFHLRYQGGSVLIEQASFAGVDEQAVRNAVAAAPEHSDRLDVKAQILDLPVLTKAIVLSLIDAINIERATHSRPAITPQAAINAIAAKADDLS